MSAARFDVLVEGGGIAGLTAAASLARRGRRVLLTERLDRLGGRCGRFTLDGHRFTIGCNDFGARIERDLADLGAAVPFAPSVNVVALGDDVHRLPPGPLGALRLLRHAPSVLRLVRRVRRGGAAPLGALYPEEERSDFAFHLLGLLAYAMGCPPSLLTADGLRANFGEELAFGHDRMLVPRGGPDAIVDALAARLDALGVTVWTSTAASRVTSDGDRFLAETARGPVSVGAVVSTAPPPPGAEHGLSVAQLLWEARPEVPFVDGRALIVSPPRPDAWLAELHRGTWPEAFGFHLFRDLVGTESVTFTGYALLPRGVETLDEGARAALLTRVEAAIERYAPGFSAAVRYRRCLDPAAYRALHGVSPALSVALPGRAPQPTEIAPGRYRMGNGVGAPGDHANAAMLSALWAADRAHAHLG
jgi:phytoene dehydrogenase-like protein